MVRMSEAAVAVGFGAVDAFVTSKVTQTLPGGIPAPVGLEVAGVLLGVLHDKVGIGADIGQPLFFSSAGLLGARLTRAALAGNLAKGPAAWGGAAGGDPSYRLSTGGDGDLAALGGAGSRSVRLLAGRRASGGLGVGGASIYPAMSEAPGVAG